MTRIPHWPIVALLATMSGCGEEEPFRHPAQAYAAGRSSVGGTGGGGGAGAGGANAGTGGTATPVTLFGAPLIFATTAQSFEIQAVVASGAARTLRAFVREEGAAVWVPDNLAPSVTGVDTATFSIAGLRPGTSYEYRLSDAAAPFSALFSGKVTTARAPGSVFTFALITDTHISPRTVEPGATDTADFAETTLLDTARVLGAERPDFVINLGDVLDFHLFGFNDPPPDGSWTRLGYLNYRRLWGDALGNTSHFRVIGNWDGENGANTEEEIDRSRLARLAYLPGPGQQTYPEGGSANQDYYAFTWGDALFIALNVMTYTPTGHYLGREPGLPDDWTLGEAQLAWLEDTLANSSAKWRFTFIHHTVGGAAGNDVDSAYGRGGGQAAHVGEQARIHQLLLRHGAQVFFYGHDHVFVDMVVDGIHYTLPGSAGAPWKFTPIETGYTDYWPDSGYARVRVGPDSVGVDFVALDQSVLYGYTLH